MNKEMKNDLYSEAIVGREACKVLRRSEAERRRDTLRASRPTMLAGALSMIAAVCLAAVGWSADISEYLNQLSNDDEDVRAAACKALGILGDEQAVPALEKKLRDSSLTVRADAADAIIRIGGVSARAAFERLVQSDNSDFRQVGVAGLAKVGTTEAVADALIGRLGDSSSRVRWVTALMLGGYGDVRAIEPLSRMAESDTNEEVKAAAREALLQLKSHIRWRRDIVAAYKNAREAKKPLLLFFCARKSDWCDSFEVNVLADAEVVDAADKFVCVRQNVEGQAGLIDKYELRGVPTVILLDAEGHEIGRVMGFKSKAILLEKMADANRTRSTFRETRRQALDNPSDADANWRTAEIYLMEDRLQLAVMHLKNVVENDPKNERGYTANALYALGFAQGRLGQHAAAITSLSRYLEEYPAHKDRGRGIYCLALTQLAMGRKNDARQNLEILIKESADSPVAAAAKLVLEKLNEEKP